MRKSSKASSSSPSSKSEKKPHLRSSKAQWPETPEKLPQRSRNRGVALSVAEIRKVAEGLQDPKQRRETTSSQAKTARRQIALPSPCKPKTVTDEPSKLPEKYEILGEFFDSLDSSIRLLRLKGSMPSFTNISPKIECLTDRRFTHGHLAQLKFILPDAIEIKKLLVFDERTSCMKPDLHVTINLDAVESDAKLLPERGTGSLRKLFRTRLRDFCKSHPEGDEIPEEILPEPFNRPKQDRLLNLLKTPSSLSKEALSDASVTHSPAPLSACLQNNDIADNTDSASIEKNLSDNTDSANQQLAVASHMSKAFTRRFSQKSKENGADNAQHKCQSDSFQPLAFPVSESSLKENCSYESTESKPKACSSEIASEAASSGLCPTVCASSNCFTSSSAPPATPSKTIEYTENKDGSLKSINATSTPAKLVCTPSRLMSATPALPAPKRACMSPDDNATSSLNKLVRRPPRTRSLKFDTPVKNEDVVGSLSIDDDIFDILPENLLQSIMEKERIAKEESEVEEQLHLLLELVPDWISEKLASSGDFLFCINKMLNPETVRASLEEAK
ncbi:Winged helix DNA-binding domain superfamily [Sesbania bispinosa]|nr:Winged helix DNA-binding domain superfamily [Sesbania bispinosa]